MDLGRKEIKKIKMNVHFSNDLKSDAENGKTINKTKQKSFQCEMKKMKKRPMGQTSKIDTKNYSMPDGKRI